MWPSAERSKMLDVASKKWLGELNLINVVVGSCLMYIIIYMYICIIYIYMLHVIIFIVEST